MQNFFVKKRHSNGLLHIWLNTLLSRAIVGILDNGRILKIVNSNSSGNELKGETVMALLEQK